MKVRVDHLVLSVGAVILLVGSLWAWRALRPEPAAAELEQGLERMRDKPGKSGKPGGGDRARPRFLLPSGAFSNRESEREGWVESQLPASVGDPGELGPREAVDNFKTVLAELEAAVDDGRRLSELEQSELYNRATGSFTVLSTWVDAGNSDERAMLDDAYGQMLALMRQLDLQPPVHDPDFNPLRR